MVGIMVVVMGLLGAAILVGSATLLVNRRPIARAGHPTSGDGGAGWVGGSDEGDCGTSDGGCDGGGGGD
jgi:hypothetical protein